MPGRCRSEAPGRSSSKTCTPHDRGPKRTHHGAIIANGNLYWPRTPRTLTEPGPLAPGTANEQTADHDRKTGELACCKPGRITRDDAGGYQGVACPAAMGKIRCPLRPASMRLDRGRPKILTPPQHPRACRAQQTLTVPAGVNAKSRQEHDYPSAAWRRSYARRTGAEHGFATAKDPSTNDISRGWCRLMGLAPQMLFLTTLLAVRNQRNLTARNARQQETPAAPPAARPKPGGHVPGNTATAASSRRAVKTAACPETRPDQHKAVKRTPTAHDTAAVSVRTRMSHPNVK